MSVKTDNIATFYSKNHGYVMLVKRSIGKYKETIVEPANRYSKQPETFFIINYWRGQLVHDWSIYDNGQTWNFSKGRLVWLNAADFHRVDIDYLQYTDI